MKESKIEYYTTVLYRCRQVKVHEFVLLSVKTGKRQERYLSQFWDISFLHCVAPPIKEWRLSVTFKWKNPAIDGNRRSMIGALAQHATNEQQHSPQISTPGCSGVFFKVLLCFGVANCSLHAKKSRKKIQRLHPNDSAYRYMCIWHTSNKNALHFVV